MDKKRRIELEKQLDAYRKSRGGSVRKLTQPARNNTIVPSVYYGNNEQLDQTESTSTSEEKTTNQDSWFGSLKQNIKDLWALMNYDIDQNDIAVAESKLTGAKQDKEDMLRIKRYVDLVREKNETSDFINAVDPNEISANQWREINNRIQYIDQEIQNLDDYFKGEGRHHKVIAENMYDGTQTSEVDYWSNIGGAIKRAWSNTPQLKWSRYGAVPQLLGGAVEGTLGLIGGVTGTIGEIASGAYGEAKDIFTKTDSDKLKDNISSLGVDYVMNMSKDGDARLNKMYRGQNIIYNRNIDDYLDSEIKDYEREESEKIEDLRQQQDNLKHLRLFGIDGAYNYDAVSEEWKNGRTQFQNNGSFWDAFAHPLYATADAAISLDMMRYQLYSMGIDGLIRRMPNAIVKRNPWVGSALLVGDIAQGVGFTVKSREEETASEAIGAMGARVAQDTQKNGGNLDKIMNAIRSDAESMGIDTTGMEQNELFQLGIALNTKTGDDAFEEAKKSAQRGINKLINANNALAANDFAQSLPMMSYFGDVAKVIKLGGNKALDNVVVGNKTLGQRMGMRTTPYLQNNEIRKNVEMNIDGYFDGVVRKAAKSFAKKDMPRAGLAAGHIGEYLKKKGALFGVEAFSEFEEEGIQHLLGQRYARGEYDDYNRNLTFLDLSMVASNAEIAGTAFADYFGLGFWDPDNGSQQLRSAMNAGYWGAILLSGGMHALTNIREATDDNIRGLVRQLKDDKVAVRMLLEQQKRLLDYTHIDMFYDRFMHGAKWDDLLKSLNDLKESLSPELSKKKKDETDEEYYRRISEEKKSNENKESLVKQEFIDDDIKLLTVAWELFSDKKTNEELEKRGIKKGSEAYRLYLRDATTALVDYYKTTEMLNKQAEDVNTAQENHRVLLMRLLNDEISQEEKQRIVTENPKLAHTIDNLRRLYDNYLNTYDDYQEQKYQDWLSKRAESGEQVDDNDDVNRLNYENLKKQSFVEKLTKKESKNSFVNNRFIRYIVKDRVAFEDSDGITKYLSELWDEIGPGNKDRSDKLKQEFDELIDKAYNQSTIAFSEIQFVQDYLKMLHNLKKRKAIESILPTIKNQKEALIYIRKMTGLDVDPSLISGWVDFLEDQLERLRKNELDRTAGHGTLEEIFKEEDDYLFDDEEDFQLQLLNYFINRATLKALAKVANAYRSMQETPGTLRDAIFGKNAQGTILDDIVNEYEELINRRNSRSEADRKIGVDDALDLEDMKRLSKKAAWAIISDRMKEQRLRKKIAHRQFDQTEEELVQITKDDKNIAIPETSVTYTGPDVEETNEEKALRKKFYHERKKRKTAKEIIDEKRRKAEGVQEESAEEEAVETKEPQPAPAESNVAEEPKEGEGPARTQKEETGPSLSEEPVTKPETENVADTNSGNTGTSGSSEGNGLNGGRGAEGGAAENHTDGTSNGKKEDQVLEDDDSLSEEPQSFETGPVNTKNIDDTVMEAELENDAEDLEDTEDAEDFEEVPETEDLPEPDMDSEFAGDYATTTDPLQDSLDETEEIDNTLLEIEGGELKYNGASISDALADALEDDLELLSLADEGPLDIDDVRSFDDSEKTEDVVGEPSPNLIWQTLFYGYNQQTPPKIVIGGELISELNGRPLKSGSELSKKLTEKGWFKSTNKYYLVTQSQEASNTKNNKDAFTVIMIIEDKDACYATFYKPVSEKVVSVSESIKTKNGENKKFVINQKEELKNDLLLHNMNVTAILKAILVLNKDLYFNLRNTQNEIKATLDDDRKEKLNKVYKKLLVQAYKEVIDNYAKELFAQNYALLNITKHNAKQIGYNQWGLRTALTIVKNIGERDEEYERRKKAWAEDVNHYKYLARKAYSRPSADGRKIIFSDAEIEKEIDRLKLVRDEIIDAYLEKDGEDYVFPDEPLINKAQPEFVSQSNGKINSVKNNGNPVLRTIFDGDTSMSEIQDQLEKEDLLIGIGKGRRPTRGGQSTIVKWGFTRPGEEEITLFSDGGLAGKVYMAVPTVEGEKMVPVMLSEEKFNVQHKLVDGKPEPMIINGSRKVKLCLDPKTGKRVPGSNVLPSAAEILLYMIIGRFSIPGFDTRELIPLFINEDAKTMLGKQPSPDDEFLQQLAAKQLYFGAGTEVVTEKTAGGKTISRKQEKEGKPYLHIGMKTTFEVESVDEQGNKVKELRTGFAEKVYSVEDIIGDEQVRQEIVLAIATQMHWNTDDFTFGNSAATDASKTVLGKLVEFLIELEAKAGKLKGKSTKEILDYRVSIEDCPQLSFRIGDFYNIPEGGSLADRRPVKGSVLAWMIKSGHIKTDLGENPFKDPFVFGHGVKKAEKPAVQNVREETSAPVLPTGQLESNNPFYDEQKESRLNKFLIRAVSIPKTLKEITEKIKKWTEFLLSGDSNSKLFAGKIDVEKNDVLGMYIFEKPSIQSVLDYAENVHDDLIDEDDDEAVDEYGAKLRDDQLDKFIETYNKSNSDKVNKNQIKKVDILPFTKFDKNINYIEALFVYRDKSTGEVKYMLSTISKTSTSDKYQTKDKHYYVDAATGVFSRQKTSGKFQEKRARKWLSEKLGIDDANVIVWDAVKNAHIDPKIQGDVDVVVDEVTGGLIGQVGLSRQGGASVHYHEAWHYVNLLLHDEYEREVIYQAYLDGHPFFKRRKPENKEIEERLAEEFRKWVLMQEDTSFIGKIRREINKAFSNIFDFLNIMNSRKQYRRYFEKIVSGDYRESKSSQAKLEHFKKEWAHGAPFIKYAVPDLSKKVREEDFVHINNHQEYFNAAQALATHWLQSKKIETEKDVKAVNKTKVEDILNELQAWVDNSEDLIQDQRDVLNDVLKNPDLVKKALVDIFSELGLTAKIKTFKSYVDKSDNKADATVPELDAEGEQPDDIPEDRADNTWDRFDLEISKRDNASIRTKLFFKQIPILKRVVKRGGKVEYVEETDDYGNVKTYSFKEAWNLIVDQLWQCESLDDRDANGYKPTSLMGMIQFYKSSNEFYESLERCLLKISGSEWRAIELRSQIYTTINSNKPQVSYLTLQDPLERVTSSDDDLFDVDDAVDESEVERNRVTADVQRIWGIKKDNEEEIARVLPRDWSRLLTAHGLTEVGKDGKTVISKEFANRLSSKLESVRTLLAQVDSENADKKLKQVLNKVVEFYAELSIPLDVSSLTTLIRMYSKENEIVSAIEQINIIKHWFAQREVNKKGEEITLKNDTPARIADAIIANAGNSEITYTGDNRTRQLDELFSNFAEGSNVYMTAVAINLVHPSAKEFSIKGPNGNRIYPSSPNSFVSDRVRKISTDKQFVEKMMNGGIDPSSGIKSSPYCKESILLLTASEYAAPLDTEKQFKLHAFVGIKDKDRNRGADYFGISPMEDYIAKMIMTEDDMIILPTMADKKTWYAISHKQLHLCHDAMLTTTYKEDVNDLIYVVYAEQVEPRPEDDFLWKKAARSWYEALDKDNEVKKEIDEKALLLYKEKHKGLQIMRYSDDTLNRFAKYMLGEVNTLLQYYDEKNIQKLINRQSRLLENFHGKVKNGRMDFSGEGGLFRYFYDVITIEGKDGKKYNLNQYLQYLYELQKKIEAGQVVNISEQDPLYKFVGQLSISDKTSLDGFELIREFLKDFKDTHFVEGFASDEIKSSINDMFISLTQKEIKKLSDRNCSYRMVKEKNGMFLPYGVPTQLIRKYAKSIYKSLTGESISIETTQDTEHEDLLQDALFSLIANFVVNSAISTIEFEKVFSGDPAFYSKKKIAKTQREANKDSFPQKGKKGTVYIDSEKLTAYIYEDGKYKQVDDSELDLLGLDKIQKVVTLQDGQQVDVPIIVDRLGDTYSDKIKRLGSTLSPGDEMRLNYTDEEIAKYPELQIKNYTNMNVEDIHAESMYMDTITDIFKKQLLIDHIRMIDKKKFEKICFDKNLQFEKGIEKLYSDDEFFKQVYELYKEVHSKIEKELKSQIDPYEDITTCDAQVFVRPELYRKIRIGLGQWTNQDERAYRIIEGVGKKYKESGDTGNWMEDEKLYNAVRQLELFPLKMSYFLNDPDPYYKEAVPGLNKMCVFPLFKFQATTDTSRKLYERMNKVGNELDMISFKSAVKVAASQNGVKMCKDGTKPSEQMCTIDELFDSRSDQYIDYRKSIRKKYEKDGKIVEEWVPNPQYGQRKYRNGKFVPVQVQSLENLRMLLNTKAHKADDRNIGTQMFKLAFSNIIDDAVYGDKTGAEIKKDIIRIVNELTKLGVLNIRQRLFKVGANGEYLPDQEKINEYIKMVAENNGLGASAEEIISRSRDGWSAVAASCSSRRVFENSVTSLVESEVVDINTTGGNAILQSCFGFVGHGNNSVKSQIGAYKINYNNGEELKWNAENGTMEVILSINFFRQVLPKEMKDKPFLEQRQWLIDHDVIKGRKTGKTSFTDKDLSIKKTLDELVPEDRTLYSGWSDETFKYLDDIGASRKYGGTVYSIILKAQIGASENVKKELDQFLKSKGVSFDTKYPKQNTTEGEMSNPKPFGVGYRIPTQGMSSMFGFTVADIMPPTVGDLIIVPREFTAQTGSDFDVDKLFLATMSYKNGELEQETDLGKTKGGLTNALLKNYLSIITDVKNYADARASIDVLTSKLKNDFVRGVIRAEGQLYTPSFFELMPSFQIDKKREFSIGKDGIAPFALNVTNLSLTQMCHLTMRYDGVVSEYGFGHLDQIYGKDGRRISAWLSAMVNAHVDVAKDPYIFDLNINHVTYNYINFLLRAGMGMSTFTFISQQSLKNIADKINSSAGIYGGNIEGNTPESEIYKKHRRLVVLNEFGHIHHKLQQIKEAYESLSDDEKSKINIAKLNSLIEFAKYNSLSHSNKKSNEDELVPELNFDRKKVFDEALGSKMIKLGRSSKLSDLVLYYEFQLACVRCFKEIEVNADGISSLVSASQIDTKKFGNTIVQHIDYANKIQHLFEDGTLWTINEEGFEQLFLNKQGNVDKKACQRAAIDRYVNDSYLNDKFTNATDLIKQILSRQLFTATSLFETSFRSAMAMINGGEVDLYEKEFNEEKLKAISEAIDNTMRFNALFNQGAESLQLLSEGSFDLTLGGNILAVIDKWQELLFGTDDVDPLWKRLAQFKQDIKSSKGKEKYPDLVDTKGVIHNELIDILSCQSPNSKISIGKITLQTSLIDSDPMYVKKLIASFSQLLNSESEEVRKLAEDLIFYAYYSNYDQNTMNSFFELVPPEYREQYDYSLFKVLSDLDSENTDVVENAKEKLYNGGGVLELLDVICRNYWYDDTIVPRYYFSSNVGESFQQAYNPVYGQEEVYGQEFGFPSYIALPSSAEGIAFDNNIKGNKYFKIKIGREVLLYRKIGEITRTNKKTGLQGTHFLIFVPIPKAGLHQNGTHLFEFYADYKTPSVFKDNRISSNFAHSLIRERVQKNIDTSNNVTGDYTCKAVWDDTTIPEAFDTFNRRTYSEIDPSVYNTQVNKVLIHGVREKSNGQFVDPELDGFKYSRVVIEFTADGKTVTEYKSEDSRFGIPDEYKEKVVTININAGTKASLYEAIKKLVSEASFARRIFVKIGPRTNVTITDEDIQEYLSIIGVDSKNAKYLLEHTNTLRSYVQQYKINKQLQNIVSRLKKDGVEGVQLDCACYGNTAAAEALLYCKLLDGDMRVVVHPSGFVMYKNKKSYDRLMNTLRFRKEDYNIEKINSISDNITKELEEQLSSENAAQNLIQSVNDQIEKESQPEVNDDVESTEDLDDMEVMPIMLDEAEKVDPEKAPDQECGFSFTDGVGDDDLID